MAKAEIQHGQTFLERLIDRVLVVAVCGCLAAGLGVWREAAVTTTQLENISDAIALLKESIAKNAEDIDDIEEKLILLERYLNQVDNHVRLRDEVERHRKMWDSNKETHP